MVLSSFDCSESERETVSKIQCMRDSGQDTVRDNECVSEKVQAHETEIVRVRSSERDTVSERLLAKDSEQE